MEEFCKALPKLELHAHLNGSLSKSTLLMLGSNESAILEYQKLAEIIDKSRDQSTNTLDACFELFQIAHKATNNTLAVYQATCSVIQEFHAANCIYLELRTTPRAEVDMSRDEYVSAVIRAIEDCRSKFSIIVKLILCLDRKFDKETNRAVMNLIIDFYKQHSDVIVGVDLCGNPKVGTFAQGSQAEFLRARQAGLKITLHCAEVDNVDEAQEMLDFAPERFGHGTFINVQQRVDALKTIPLEICLSSNVIIGSVDSFEKHHIQSWISLGLPFCLCTDDKGVFMSDISSEYFLAHKHYNLSAEELYNISLSSVDYIFASDDATKQQLKQKFEDFKSKDNKLNSFAL